MISAADRRHAVELIEEARLESQIMLESAQQKIASRFIPARQRLRWLSLLTRRFAPALACLAEALTMQSIGFSVHAPSEMLPRAGDLAARALELDAQLPEAHLARALFKMYWERDYSEAKESLDRALEKCRPPR